MNLTAAAPDAMASGLNLRRTSDRVWPDGSVDVDRVTAAIVIVDRQVCPAIRRRGPRAPKVTSCAGDQPSYGEHHHCESHGFTALMHSWRCGETYIRVGGKWTYL